MFLIFVTPPKTSANAYERWWMFDNHFTIITNWRRMTFASTFAIVWEHYKTWGIYTPFTSYKGQRALTELFWPLGPFIKIVCLLSPDRLTIVPPLKNVLRSGDFFTHFYYLYDSMFALILNITLTIIQMFYLTAENRSLTTRHWIHEDYLTSHVYKKKITSYRPTLRILGRVTANKNIF